MANGFYNAPSLPPAPSGSPQDQGEGRMKVLLWHRICPRRLMGAVTVAVLAVGQLSPSLRNVIRLR